MQTKRRECYRNRYCLVHVPLFHSFSAVSEDRDMKFKVHSHEIEMLSLSLFLSPENMV